MYSQVRVCTVCSANILRIKKRENKSNLKVDLFWLDPVDMNSVEGVEFSLHNHFIETLRSIFTSVARCFCLIWHKCVLQHKGDLVINPWFLFKPLENFSVFNRERNRDLMWGDESQPQHEEHRESAGPTLIMVPLKTRHGKKFYF